MSKMEIVNIKNEKVKDVNLKDNIWKNKPNDAVLYNAIILAQASLRQGTHKTKTRSEVSGGGRKPYRQKGTGNARQGSIRATQWRGGGIVFGPQPRDFDNKRMNRKERKLALRSALAYKEIDKAIVVVDSLAIETNKTKDMKAILNSLKIADKKVLMVVEELNDNLIMATRNLANIVLLETSEINTLDVISADVMLITKAAAEKIGEVLV